MLNISKFIDSIRSQSKQATPKYPYNAQGYYVVDHKFEQNRPNSRVTVITPVYNAEKFLRKTIDSVINQSLGMESIEYILVDDHSTDSTRDILLEYSSKFENIIAIFMKNNSGTPGRPRNIGMEHATSPYITFLDADDWLEPNGLEVLHRILEETGDDYVVGKTIKVERKKTSTIGEHESCRERRSVSPFSIPHIFNHLGPRARMFRTNIIRENHIQFPEMKFAEDKQFFIDILIHSKSISTTKVPIYYLNRLDNSQTRLTNQTNILQKTDCNLKVIRYILDKDIDINKKKLILNRLYEFDSINRFFMTPHYEKTKLKRLYYTKFNKVIKTTQSLEYEIADEFMIPTNKVKYDLLRTKKYRDLEKLVIWEKNEKVKEVYIRDQLPYTVAPITNENNKYIRIPMYATLLDDSFNMDMYSLKFKVYGDHLDNITDVLFQKWNDAHVEFTVPVNVDSDGNGLLKVSLEQLSKFPASSYSVFLRYNDYMKTNIRKTDQTPLIHQYNDLEFSLIQTSYSNIALKISTNKSTYL
ncbi:MAG: glycosyltransferase family 2 protein [Bacillota bacterium]